MALRGAFRLGFSGIMVCMSYHVGVEQNSYSLCHWHSEEFALLGVRELPYTD